MTFSKSTPRRRKTAFTCVAGMKTEQDRPRAVTPAVGGGTYKVRFLPMSAGEYSWRVTGAAACEGREICEAAVTHGPVRASGRGFAYADGTVFHPFGTTVYALAHQPRELIDRTFGTLSAAPFNKVRLCVFPKDYDFNKNEPDYYAFERSPDGSRDTSRPCFEFWDALEENLRRLDALGIQADLILFHPYDRWGFNGMGHGKDLTYLDYLTRRLASFPNIWWSLANEYELTARTGEELQDIEAFVSAHDPYGHPLSCHNIFNTWDANRPLTTHASIQTKDLTRLSVWQERFAGKPVIIESLPGQLEGETGTLLKLLKVARTSSAERDAVLAALPEHFGVFVKALAGSPDAESYAYSEIGWYGHIGTDVYLRFHDARPITRDTLELPEDKKYTVRVLDTWSMTEETVANGVSGRYTVPLPGRENMAVLATAE